MMQVHDGQCGLCTHFGESNAKDAVVVQIRTKQSAPENFIEKCGHPKHAPLNLMVTPISGCDGFKPAEQVH